MLNSCQLQGRFTAAPMLREQGEDKIPFVRFTLAVERNYLEGGERRSDFISVTAWRQTANFIAGHFTKGSQAIVEGSLHTRTYVSEEGERRTTYEVVADTVHFSGGKKAEPTEESREEVLFVEGKITP